MFKKKSILCVFLAIMFILATSCANQSGQDSSDQSDIAKTDDIVKTKEEWITEFAKNVCETDLKRTDPDPFHFKANGDYHYIYELLIYEDYEIYQKKCNYTFNQIAIAHHNNFYLFSVYLLVEDNPNNDNNYNPEKSFQSCLRITVAFLFLITSEDSFRSVSHLRISPFHFLQADS